MLYYNTLQLHKIDKIKRAGTSREISSVMTSAANNYNTRLDSSVRTKSWWPKNRRIATKSRKRNSLSGSRWIKPLHLRNCGLTVFRLPGESTGVQSVYALKRVFDAETYFVKETSNRHQQILAFNRVSKNQKNWVSKCEISSFWTWEDRKVSAKSS